MARAWCSTDLKQGVARSLDGVADIVTEKFLKTDLRNLITEDGAWKAFEKAAELSSEEGAALRDALKESLAQELSDGNDGPERKQQKERFLREFPELKKKLEDHIRKLRELADHLDQVHKDCTISNVVSTSASAISGAMGLLALGLVPLTEGASLLLSAASVGLGETASVTGLTTTVVEESMRRSDESEASRLVRASMNVFKEIVEIMSKITFKVLFTVMGLVPTVKILRDHIRAMRRAGVIIFPREEARNLTSTERSSVLAVFPMTRGVKIRTAGFTSLSLVWDVYDLVKQSKDLYNGAKTESAGALRELAHKLEEKLQVFEQIYKVLQSDLPH
ncbi:apolipoprotein L3-like [Mus caroli]|uniref:Apolipoprotein L3-like n=1 Tax=Mus caroli TaxID=10089 RepID=A0A6P7QHA5_MUSCR|nr:apolipoprotein L3-like [Mus caroli]